MNKKPIIGLSASKMRLEGSYLTGMPKALVNQDYIDAVVRAGGLPIIIPPTATREELDVYVEMCDGVLMTGGMDVAPILYKEMPHPKCGNYDLDVDRSNMELIKAAMAAEKPLLGVCRGMQLINVVLGGTLYQDIPAQVEGCGGHSFGYDRGDVVHEVHVKEGTPLSEIFGTTTIEVNSIHHQAVKALGEGIEICGLAPDGVIESLYVPDKKIFAVQWHPEMLLTKSNDMLCIFDYFINQCV